MFMIFTVKSLAKGPCEGCDLQRQTFSSVRTNADQYHNESCSRTRTFRCLSESDADCLEQSTY